ncbi:MAG: hypothetical protein QXG40_04185 [Ignisphaera sp.]
MEAKTNTLEFACECVAEMFNILHNITKVKRCERCEELQRMMADYIVIWQCGRTRVEVEELISIIMSATLHIAVQHTESIESLEKRLELLF